MAQTETSYTYAQVGKAAEAAADLILKDEELFGPATGSTTDSIRIRGLVEEVGHDTLNLLGKPGASFAGEQVSKAINAAADEVLAIAFPYECSDSIRVRSLIDLAVAATMHLLDEPDMTLDDVIRANWQAEPDGEDVVDMVRGWVS